MERLIMVYLDAHPNPNVDKPVDAAVEGAILDEFPQLPPTNLYSDAPPWRLIFTAIKSICLLIRLLKYCW
jgi:hypothetical protein